MTSEQADAALKEALDSGSSIDSGWRPIETEPKDDVQFLVSTDPTDPECAQLVALTPGGQHFNKDVILENFGYVPTHWHPIPVQK